ncbi:MAG: riboflavin biosynthesis protein RibF [Prevotellaceae bacterium]|jgi:riboflavin kinase/FMN adenylyltransferase|nr:riboflavin biosynthesis protein RibF [Prevotellaceae bacterium]
MVKYIATTGFFDGVHKGHVAVLNRLKETGLRLKTPVCAVTFWPHPRIVLNSEADKLKLLSTVEEKKQRIEALGIDRVTVIPFTREFANISPQQFITELVEKYDIAGLCVGYDHHIGKDRTGGFDAIKKICEGLGLFCEQVPPLMTGDNRIISSQKIRERLTEGNVEEANSMLGYSYTLSGTVVHGKQIGRTIGFPTANIELKSSKLIPCDGVYAAGIRIDSDSRQDLKGMLYVGRKSDADNSPKTFIEVNIFDFDRDIYNREISVSFEHFVRKNMKFNDVDEMKAQLTEDRLAIQKILNTNLCLSIQSVLSVC